MTLRSRKTPPRLSAHIPVLVTALTVAAVMTVSALAGFDEHVVSHGVAGLILGLLAIGVARMVSRSRALAAIWPMPILFHLLVASVVVQGVEAALAGLEGETGQLHDMVVTFASWCLLAAAGLYLCAVWMAIRKQVLNGWLVLAAGFMTWWSVMVNFVPYNGS